MTKLPNLEAAENFICLNARVLDRHRYAHLFKGAGAEPVVAALRAYQNPDGGFGNALEQDLRTPTSQPAAVWTALEILDEIDRFDDPMVKGSCDFLMANAAPDGGAPFVLPSAMAHPRAPWWQTEDDPLGSLVQTGSIVAQLLKHQVDHPWLEPATVFCWRQIEAIDATSAYEMRFLLPFLESAPDRERAESAFQRVGPKILEQNLVALDPNAEGEHFTPLDYAPRPDSIARRLFDDDVIDAHLDALARGQEEDGGWTVHFLNWNPVTTYEWRGSLTVDALKTLQTNGRLR